MILKMYVRPFFSMSGEKNQKMTPAEIMPHYKSKRARDE
jgi:hypothetical protein